MLHARSLASSSSRLAVLVLAIFLASNLQAASAHFSRLSVRDGLSQSSVEVISEDRNGFLWFGTQEGLNRFDGYEFVVHLPAAKPGRLRDGFIQAIVPDRRGDLWVGTLSGLQHLNVATGRFGETVTPAGIGVRLNTLHVAADGRLWFASESGGLWTRRETEAGPAQRVITGLLGANARVTAVTAGAPGMIWIAGDGQLFQLQVKESGRKFSVASRLVLPGAGIVRAIHIDDGGLWLGRQNASFLRFDPRSGVVTEYPELPRFVLTIAAAGNGRMWIGGKGAGVRRFDPKTREIVTYRNEPGNAESLADDDVAVVHQDQGGSLWAGAWNGGVSRLNLYSQAFATLRNRPEKRDSLPDNDVTRMAESPDGRLWVVTRNDVLAVGVPGSGSFRTLPLARDLTSIAFAGPVPYVGTTSGLVEIDPVSGLARAPREIVRSAGLDRMAIEAMAGAGDHLWIIAGGSLYRLTLGGSGALQRVSLPPIREMTSLYASPDGRLWIGCADSTVLRADAGPDAITIRRIGDASLGARGRLGAVTEHDGVLWVGAAKGIGRLSPEGGSVAWIDLEQGMPSRTVGSILGDDRGILWFATERGITSFNPSTRRAVHFGGAQGAQDSGYVEGSAARGQSGVFYFAGRGITTFDPRRVSVNPYRPRVVFTALEIRHRPVLASWMDSKSPLPTELHAAEEVTLSPDAIVFSVAMAAPGVNDPEGVHFSHRLDGFDEEWIESNSDRRIATYMSLAPGRYVLRARARSQSGVWSKDETRLEIRILPPWWRTPVALAAWLALVMLMLAAIVQQLRRRTSMRIMLAEQGALRRASVTDPLTGLYNRRFLAEWLKLEIPRTLRTHRLPTALGSRPEALLFIMIDLDDLKRINDAFGHDAGDRVIQALAKLLESHARADDLAVRLGGDEFVLVIRLSDRSQASQVVERLRAGSNTLDAGFGESSRSTISLGFAQFPFVEHEADALTWEQTMQLADRALLHSKRRGGNVWTGFVATPQTTAADVLLHLLDAGDLSTTLLVMEGPEMR